MRAEGGHDHAFGCRDDFTATLFDGDADDVFEAASREKTVRTKWFSRITESCFQQMLRFYDATLRWSLRHSLLIFLVLLGSTALNFYLFNIVPKGFFPQQDSGTLLGGVQADPAISFQLMRKKLEQIQTIVQNDPAVDSVVANTGGRQPIPGMSG